MKSKPSLFVLFCQAIFDCIGMTPRSAFLQPSPKLSLRHGKLICKIYKVVDLLLKSICCITLTLNFALLRLQFVGCFLNTMCIPLNPPPLLYFQHHRQMYAIARATSKLCSVHIGWSNQQWRCPLKMSCSMYMVHPCSNTSHSP
jgi:hypothetical protein